MAWDKDGDTLAIIQDKNGINFGLLFLILINNEMLLFQIKI